jgi:hypothetical protein
VSEQRRHLSVVLMVATAAVIAAIAYVKSTLTHRQQEKYKAEELVAVVLRRLQDQVSLEYPAIYLNSRLGTLALLGPGVDAAPVHPPTAAA